MSAVGSLGVLLTAGALIAVVVGSAGAANPASATTTTNQLLTVEITLSTTNDPVWLGTAVNASAEATLGDGDTANIVYVVDVSGSMENPDFNPPQPPSATATETLWSAPRSTRPASVSSH